MKFLKEESYIDKEFDYGAGEVEGKDIFSLTKTGFSYYDNFLNSNDLEYMQKDKGLTGRIEYMRPGEYFNETGKMFNRSGEADYKATIREQDAIDDLKEIITKHKRKFPLPYLNYATNVQEGRHRMAAAAQLFGWNEKFPVLIITNY